MPIRPEYRWLYPIDWKQLSAVIRFERAKGQCQGCGRPHGRITCHLGDGRWWDRQRQSWRDGEGRRVGRVLEVEDLQEQVRTTRVVLAAAHRDHDPTNNRPRNLVALCQRCHLQHDREEHRSSPYRATVRRQQGAPQAISLR
jgi:5-methylcytosine-specific restriction endonuclease McrA